MNNTNQQFLPFNEEEETIINQPTQIDPSILNSTPLTDNLQLPDQISNNEEENNRRFNDTKIFENTQQSSFNQQQNPLPFSFNEEETQFAFNQRPQFPERQFLLNQEETNQLPFPERQPEEQFQLRQQIPIRQQEEQFPIRQQIPMRQPEEQFPIRQQIPMRQPEEQFPIRQQIPMRQQEEQFPIRQQIPMRQPEEQFPIRQQIPMRQQEEQFPIRQQIPMRQPEEQFPIRQPEGQFPIGQQFPLRQQEEKIMFPSEEQQMLPEQLRLMFPEEEQFIVPEESLIVPKDEQLLIPEERLFPEEEILLIPEEEKLLFPEEEDLMFPEEEDKMIIPEEERLMIPEEERLMIPEERLMIPEERLMIPEEKKMMLPKELQLMFPEEKKIIIPEEKPKKDVKIQDEKIQDVKKNDFVGIEINSEYFESKYYGVVESVNKNNNTFKFSDEKFLLKYKKYDDSEDIELIFPNSIKNKFIKNDISIKNIIDQKKSIKFYNLYYNSICKLELPDPDIENNFIVLDFDDYTYYGKIDNYLQYNNKKMFFKFSKEIPLIVYEKNITKYKIYFKSKMFDLFYKDSNIIERNNLLEYGLIKKNVCKNANINKHHKFKNLYQFDTIEPEKPQVVEEKPQVVPPPEPVVPPPEPVVPPPEPVVPEISFEEIIPPIEDNIITEDNIDNIIREITVEEEKKSKEDVNMFNLQLNDILGENLDNDLISELDKKLNVLNDEINLLNIDIDKLNKESSKYLSVLIVKLEYLVTSVKILLSRLLRCDGKYFNKLELENIITENSLELNKLNTLINLEMKFNLNEYVKNDTINTDTKKIISKLLKIEKEFLATNSLRDSSFAHLIVNLMFLKTINDFIKGNIYYYNIIINIKKAIIKSEIILDNTRESMKRKLNNDVDWYRVNVKKYVNKYKNELGLNKLEIQRCKTIIVNKRLNIINKINIIKDNLNKIKNDEKYSTIMTNNLSRINYLNDDLDFKINFLKNKNKIILDIKKMEDDIDDELNN